MKLAGNPHELRTKFNLGGPIGDYLGFWGGPIKGYTTNLVQGSHVSFYCTMGGGWCFICGKTFPE